MCNMKKVWRVCLEGLSALCLLLSGCSNAETERKPGDIIQVTTTTGMVADLVKNIGGNHVEVIQLMGAGVDPHLYKASQGDIKRIEDADIIFYSGLFLEGQMQEIFDKIGKSKPVYAVTASIPKDQLLSGALEGLEFDPHVWFDVSLWMKGAELVRDRLKEFAPEFADEFDKNAAAYLSELEKTHQYAREQLATIPKESRVLVTAHDAFHYFGRAYDIEVKGLQGISTASEYGLKDVQLLVDELVKRNIKAVFIESSVPKRSIEAVVEGAKAKNHNVTIGGQLFSDAMGEPGTPEGTYIGMVRHNVDTIVQALK